MRIKQIITYTNGTSATKYFRTAKESQQHYAVTICSPVVQRIEPQCISEEEYNNDQATRSNG